MTENDVIQAISVNLLRMSEWYYKNPDENRALCERYLVQNMQLRERVTTRAAQSYLRRLDDVSFAAGEDVGHAAERCLTLGVLLQHPDRWLVP